MTTSTCDLDTKRYGRLLAKTVPTVIKSEQENARTLSIIEDLMARGEKALTPEEDALLELLLDLVHAFETKHYPLALDKPHEMVAFLLEQRGLTPSSLWPILGSKDRVSEVLSGKRAISKEQARKLAAYFNVGVQLFI